MKNRIASIEIFKVISSILVIAIHTTPLKEFNENLSYIIVQYISRVAVPFFFILTGYFYQNNKDRINYGKKYILNTLKIYIVGILIYFPYDFLYEVLYKGDKILITGILSYIHRLIFVGPHFHLWYFPAVILGVFLIDYLEKKNYLKKYKTIVLIVTGILYILGMIGSSYSGIIETLNFSKQFELYKLIFVRTRNGLFFAFPMIYLGYRISENPRVTCKNYVILAKILLGFILLNIELLTINHFKIAGSDLSMTLSIVYITYWIYIYLLNNPCKNINFENDYSLNIYLVHVIFIIFFKRIFGENYTLLFILVTILSFLSAKTLKLSINYFNKGKKWLKLSNINLIRNTKNE